MKKEWTRDYATGAFLRFGSLGCPTEEEYRTRIATDVARRMLGQDRALIDAKIHATIEARAPIIADIVAVQDTLASFREEGHGEIADTVGAVYFSFRGKLPARGELVLRIRAAATVMYADERTLYRRLKSARERFSRYRGLTLEEEEDYTALP